MNTREVHVTIDETDTKEMVNHPSHYGGEDNPYEVVKVLEAWGLDMDFYLGNTIKYIARAGKKDETLQELRKALWYLKRRIKKLEQDRKAPGI